MFIEIVKYNKNAIIKDCEIFSDAYATENEFLLIFYVHICIYGCTFVVHRVWYLFIYTHRERRARLGGAHQSPTAGRNEMNSSNFFSYIFKIVCISRQRIKSENETLQITKRKQGEKRRRENNR